ncbi:hypothetical protein ABPG72_021538 [Tetrahymena utriculariae]
MGIYQSKFIENNFNQLKQSRTLCFLQQDLSKTYFNLVFSEGNYEQQMNQSEFIQFLQKYSQNNIKIISFLGEAGQGKSQILNFLVKEFYNESKYFSIFPVGKDSNTCTQGIKFYIPQNLKEPEMQNEEITIFFDCQGFDYSSENIYMQNIIKLICMITRMSACLFYVHLSERNPEGFQKVINCLNVDNTELSQTHDNFIEILNKWNGDERIQLYQSMDKYSELIKKTYKLHSFNFQNNQIKNDESFQKFIDQVKEIKNYCISSKYSTSQESCKAFEKDQKCNSFMEILICCFQIIENRQMDAKLFHYLLNKQLELKNIHDLKMKDLTEEMELKDKEIFDEMQKQIGSCYISDTLLFIFHGSISRHFNKKINSQFHQAYQEWKIGFEQALINCQNINQNINQQQLNEIINQCKNLESIQPQQIRIYNRILNQQTNKNYLSNILKFFDIRNVSLVTKLPAATKNFIFSIFYTFKNFQTKRNSNKEIQENLLKDLFDRINSGSAKPNQQNFLVVQNILMQRFKQYQNNIQHLNGQQQKVVSLLLFMNFTSKQNQEKKNLNEKQNQSLQKDVEILEQSIQICLNNMQQFQIDLKKLYFANKIKIEDNEFIFFKAHDRLDFKSNQLQQEYVKIYQDFENQRGQLQKHLFVLKNRNESLFMIFIYEIFFRDFLLSVDFLNVMANEPKMILEEIVKIQTQLISIY